MLVLKVPSQQERDAGGSYIFNIRQHGCWSPEKPQILHSRDRKSRKKRPDRKDLKPTEDVENPAAPTQRRVSCLGSVGPHQVGQPTEASANLKLSDSLSLSLSGALSHTHSFTQSVRVCVCVFSSVQKLWQKCMTCESRRQGQTTNWFPMRSAHTHTPRTL